MILSEEQARTKWCPFAKVAGTPGSEFEGVSFNRGYDYPTGNGGAAGCIASDCMAWRACESTFHVDKGRFLEPGERFLSTDKTESRPNGNGYCGLSERDF